MTFKPYAFAALLPLLARPVSAQEAAVAPPAPPTVQSAITLTLSTGGNAEQRATPYTCEETDGFTVHYINAEPNFLALVPIDGRTMVFTAVMSGSGARYVAGEYEWWTQGPDATLRNLADGQDAPALATCAEFSNTP